jgi:Tfp pilus assembly protein PilF
MDKAEAMSKKSLEKEPQNASYLDTYGWILYQRGKYEEAAKYIIQSLDIEKNNAEVNEHYGDVQYKLGNVDKAVEYWKNAKQYGSDSPTLDKKISNQKIVE